MTTPKKRSFPTFWFQLWPLCFLVHEVACPDCSKFAVVHIISVQHEIWCLPFQRRVWGDLREVYRRQYHLIPHGVRKLPSRVDSAASPLACVRLSRSKTPVCCGVAVAATLVWCRFFTDISNLLADELALLVCIKPYDVLAVRNRHVEIKPVNCHLDVRLGVKEEHFLSPRRLVGDFQHVLVSLLSFRGDKGRSRLAEKGVSVLMFASLGCFCCRLLLKAQTSQFENVPMWSRPFPGEIRRIPIAADEDSHPSAPNVCTFQDHHQHFLGYNAHAYHQ